MHSAATLRTSFSMAGGPHAAISTLFWPGPMDEMAVLIYADISGLPCNRARPPGIVDGEVDGDGMDMSSLVAEGREGVAANVLEGDTTVVVGDMVSAGKFRDNSDEDRSPLLKRVKEYLTVFFLSVPSKPPSSFFSSIIWMLVPELDDADDDAKADFSCASEIDFTEDDSEMPPMAPLASSVSGVPDEMLVT